MAGDVEEQVAHAVASKMDSGTKWLLRRELDKLPAVLPPGEEIVHMAQGRLEGGTGLIVTTDRRLLFFEQGVSHRRVEDFPYEVVSSVQADVTVVASTLAISTAASETALESVYPKARTMEIAEYVRSRISAPSSAHSLGRQPHRQ